MLFIIVTYHNGQRQSKNSLCSNLVFQIKDLKRVQKLSILMQKSHKKSTEENLTLHEAQLYRSLSEPRGFAPDGITCAPHLPATRLPTPETALSLYAGTRLPAPRTARDLYTSISGNGGQVSGNGGQVALCAGILVPVRARRWQAGRGHVTVAWGLCPPLRSLIF